MNIFSSDFDLEKCLSDVRDNGYYFANCASKELIQDLTSEVKGLPFEYGDHINYPINEKKKYQVTQSHERYYKMFGDITVPKANLLCKKLKQEIAKHSNKFSELENWQPIEIGYQKYRDSRDFISPHRDRWSDKKLSVTITMAGCAKVIIYKPLTDPVDYAHIESVYEFETVPGTMLFLRAGGFGNGNQVIHEVKPPTSSPRYILNLRTRETLLKAPSE